MVGAEVVAAGAALQGCNDPASYAHLGVDVSLSGLAPAQRAEVATIVIRSHAEGSTDPAATYEVHATPSELDTKLAYHFDYTPYPQSGAFLVTATLLDAKNQQIAIKTDRVVLAKGKTVRAKIDFVSEVTTTGPCTPEGDPVTISDGPAGSTTFALLWDQDHYEYVYGDLSHGKGDLVSVRLDALGNRLGDPVIVNESPRTSQLPSLAKVGDGYVVAWQEGDTMDVPVSIQLRHLDASGAPKGNIREITTNADEARPQIVGAFDKVAMTWIDHQGPNDAREHLAMVALLDANDFAYRGGAPISLTAPGAKATIADSYPSIASVGGVLSAGWVSDDTSVYTTTIGPDLTTTPPVLVHTSTFTEQQLWMVPAGDRFFSSWEDLSGDVDAGRERIRFAYTSLDASVGAQDFATAPLSGSANWPRGAYDGHDDVAVVYYQYRDFGSQIYFARFTRDGAPLDEPPVQVTNVVGETKYPNLALSRSDATGDHFGVGWVSDDSGIRRVYFRPLVCVR